MTPDRAIMLARAARMRRELTEPERRLWRHLRHAHLDDYKFRRQAAIDYRIVDFFCPEKDLIVEIDGGTHEPNRDALRDTEMLERRGFVTLRFANRDVMENAEGVLRHIRATLDSLPARWFGAPPLKAERKSLP